MRNLILHHLEAIIESGSVIGACRRLFLSQPALSQYIKRLEAEYGIVIFDRSVSPWKLTEEGEHLLETQRKIQQLDEECRQFFRDRKGLKSGTVRIGSTAYRTATILNPILSVYKKQYPNVIVRIEERLRKLLNLQITGRWIAHLLFLRWFRPLSSLSRFTAKRY